MNDIQDELALLKMRLDDTHAMECNSVAGVEAKYRAISRLELEIAKVRALMEMAAQ